MVNVDKIDPNLLKVTFPYTKEVHAKIRTIRDCTWNAEQKHWQLAYSIDNMKHLNDLFSDQCVFSAELYIDKMIRDLTLQNYSGRTISAYVMHNRHFLNAIGKSPCAIVLTDIEQYLLHILKQKPLAPSTINLVINSLRYFYGVIMNREFVNQIKRVKGCKKIPNVLSHEEIRRLIDRTDNLKHKALLVLTYSGGLRVSEVVHLKIFDIDFDRKLIHVRQAKGKKDRMTILSKTAITVIKEYLDSYKAKEWLFPGQDKKRPLSIRSAEKVFEIGLARAGIEKDASIHCLRHSFATHLLEDGTDIQYIQMLLGHESSKTTEIYLHFSANSFKGIRSPIDIIYENN